MKYNEEEYLNNLTDMNDNTNSDIYGTNYFE
jgi:hypothetical protein